MFTEEYNHFHINDIEIQLHRSMCYGNCPCYSLTILGFGKLFYFGESNVLTLGFVETTIPKEKVFSLLEYAVKIGFFGMKEIYLGPEEITYAKSGAIKHQYFPRTDGPTYTVSIKIKNKIKTVIDYQDAPQSLRLFEDLIDEICESHKWTGIKRVKS